jgi:hypothetical protein
LIVVLNPDLAGGSAMDARDAHMAMAFKALLLSSAAATLAGHSSVALASLAAFMP